MLAVRLRGATGPVLRRGVKRIGRGERREKEQIKSITARINRTGKARYQR